MYVILILFTMSGHSDIMKTESERYETLVECEKNRDRVLKFKESNSSYQGMKVKDAFCIKKE